MSPAPEPPVDEMDAAIAQAAPASGDAARAREAAMLAAAHHEALYRWARALSGWSREEAMEVVQRTYMEVIEGRADLLAARDPCAFLFGVARRQAASLRRRRSIWGRVLRLEQGRAPRDETPDSPEQSAADGERLAALRRAVLQLEGRQLQVVTLVFLEGLTIEAAAGAMGVSLGSARTHYHRAKRKLARLLEVEDDR
jgi:RNA polymerase sigma factor (sigma-70 family)